MMSFSFTWTQSMPKKNLWGYELWNVSNFWHNIKIILLSPKFERLHNTARVRADFTFKIGVDGVLALENDTLFQEVGVIQYPPTLLRSR